MSMAFEHKDNEGSLFKNDRKEKSTQPDFRGSAKIEGVDYWLSAWTNSKGGNQHIAVRVTRKDKNAPIAKPNLKVIAGTLAEQMDDEVPF